jgi:superfamily II DNA/RNA helicase
MSVVEQAVPVPTEALQRLVDGEAQDVSLRDPSVLRRLQEALADPGAAALDLAVLLRHALRWQSLQPDWREHGQLASVIVPIGARWPEEALWRRLGVETEPHGQGLRLVAHPWRPSWLPGTKERAVDAAAAAALPRRPHQSVPGDPFLRRFGRETYQSAGQRTAIRAALTAPPGSTLLICLPTGDGKSFIFQLVSTMGFGDEGEVPGVTVVVTPTVALALDQERAAAELDLPNVPRAYRGGVDNAVLNRYLAERIAEGSQGLCFASPEAVCGPLRVPLMRAAEGGYLRALVIDEAHLVDAWGADFRPEFQLLAGVRRELLRASPDNGIRTLLLSATVTPQVAAELQRLFGTDAGEGPGRFAVVSAARLRPEIEYWVAPMCDGPERAERVEEALLHLPRPAILYVTERSHAVEWFGRLSHLGFRRTVVVTGETPTAEREAAVTGWRGGSIDLVVGTSAFGLGIDNPNVRAVVHACIPETLDRFYQEVGRGGRDGAACVSLCVPTYRDRKDADGLNKKRLITVERGLQRWRAMFNHPAKEFHGGDTLTVPVDVPPGEGERDVDMVGKRSTGWSVRTLTLMAAARLVVLEGSETRLPGPDVATDARHQGGPLVFQTLVLREPGHLERDVWEERVEPVRQALNQAGRQNLALMYRFLRNTQCAADVLAPLYEMGAEGALPAVRVARSCGGCPHCRATGAPPYAAPAFEPPYPWPSSGSRHASIALDARHRLVVYYPQGEGAERLPGGRELVQTLTALLKHRARNLITLPEAWVDLERLQERLGTWPLFHTMQITSTFTLNGLQPGLTVVFVPPGARLSELTFALDSPIEGRVYLLPEDFEDPARPGARLRERYAGRELAWRALREELLV